MPAPMLFKERTPSLVALTLLFVMLAAHIVLRTTDDLSPWKGGGFAMFSTVDSPGLRTVAVWADVAGVEERVSLVEPWDQAGHELRALPSPARTAALARAVASSPLVRRADGSLAMANSPALPMLVPTAGPAASAAGTAVIPTTDHETVVEVRRIRVDVTRLSYDGGVVRATLLRSASVNVVPHG